MHGAVAHQAVHSRHQDGLEDPVASGQCVGGLAWLIGARASFMPVETKEHGRA